MHQSNQNHRQIKIPPPAALAAMAAQAAARFSHGPTLPIKAPSQNHAPASTQAPVPHLDLSSIARSAVSEMDPNEPNSARSNNSNNSDGNKPNRKRSRLHSSTKSSTNKTFVNRSRATSDMSDDGNSTGDETNGTPQKSAKPIQSGRKKRSMTHSGAKKKRSSRHKFIAEETSADTEGDREEERNRRGSMVERVSIRNR